MYVNLRKQPTSLVLRGASQQAADTLYELSPFDVDVFSWAVDYEEWYQKGSLAKSYEILLAVSV
jgi:hypothetical protein